jgi:hypothetical protein
MRDSNPVTTTKLALHFAAIDKLVIIRLPL